MRRIKWRHFNKNKCSISVASHVTQGIAQPLQNHFRTWPCPFFDRTSVALLKPKLCAVRFPPSNNTNAPTREKKWRPTWMTKVRVTVTDRTTPSVTSSIGQSDARSRNWNTCKLMVKWEVPAEKYTLYSVVHNNTFAVVLFRRVSHCFTRPFCNCYAPTIRN